MSRPKTTNTGYLHVEFRERLRGVGQARKITGTQIRLASPGVQAEPGPAPPRARSMVTTVTVGSARGARRHRAVALMRAATTQAIDLRPSSPHRPRRIGAVHGPTYRQNDSIRARTHVLTRPCGKTPESGGNTCSASSQTHAHPGGLRFYAYLSFVVELILAWSLQG